MVAVLASCATPIETVIEQGPAVAVQGSEEEPEPKRQPRDRPLTVVVDPGEITIHSHGSEPRELLSLHPQIGAVQRLAVVQSGEQWFDLADEGIDPVSFPTMSLDTTLTVNRIEGDAVDVEVLVDSATLADGSTQAIHADEAALMAQGEVSALDSDSVMVEQAALLLSGLSSSSLSLRSTRSGHILSDQPVLGAGVVYEPLVLGYVERSIFGLVDPLPSEPVGQGASWSLSSAAMTEPIPAEVERSYEVIEITSEYVRASVTRRVTYLPGTYEDTKVLPGSQLVGSGEVLWLRNGIFGGAEYQLDGNIHYGIGTANILTQTIRRNVAATVEILHEPEPEPTLSPEPHTVDGPSSDNTGSGGEGQSDASIDTSPTAVPTSPSTVPTAVISTATPLPSAAGDAAQVLNAPPAETA